MNLPIKTAHYTATKTRKFITIVEAGRPFSEGVVITVYGKADARRMAAVHGAKPWNF